MKIYSIVFLFILGFLPYDSGTALDSFCFVGTAHADSDEAYQYYNDGRKELKRGNCQSARELFLKAIRMAPEDKTIRKGMFTEEYKPNAAMRELEKQCEEAKPASTPIPVVEKPAHTPAQASTPIPVVAKPIPTPAPIVAKPTPVSIVTKPTPAPLKSPVPIPKLILTLKSPASESIGLPFEKDKISLEGRVTGGKSPISVTQDGRQVKIRGGGVFSTQLHVNEGKSKIKIEAKDALGTVESKVITVNRAEAPVVQATLKPTPKETPTPTSKTTQSPAASPQKPEPLGLSVTFQDVPMKDSKKTTGESICSGKVTGGSGPFHVTINKIPFTVSKTGEFSGILALSEGKNVIRIEVVDSLGNKETQKWLAFNLMGEVAKKHPDYK
ncbi:MAG: hypothetical protein HQK89_07840 [Nitrospirae bacterium]|nr:hypothetical protein [Nitrospirota bacterium]